MNLTFSKITYQQFSTMMLDEAHKEGWNYSKYDVEFYFYHKNNRIFAALIDSELAGCVILHESSARMRGKEVRSVGFFLVINKFRGQKIVGPYLWKNAITEHITDEMIVCFNSVPRALAFYERLNFCKTAFIHNFYVLKCNRIDNSLHSVTAELLKMGKLRVLSHEDSNEIKKYTTNLLINSLLTGVYEFISEWILRPDAHILAYYHNGALNGYGIVTICKVNNNEFCYRISPIYAESPTIAAAILKGLIHFAVKSNGQCIELNTIASKHSDFGNVLKEIGFELSGRNYIVCNQPNIFKKQPIIDKLFCSLPLEYPPEVLAIC